VLGPSAMLGQAAARSLLLLYGAQGQPTESGSDGVELNLNLSDSGFVGCGGAAQPPAGGAAELLAAASVSLCAKPGCFAQRPGWSRRLLPDPSPQHP